MRKLSINESKLLENEELVNLRGGYYGYVYDCSCNGTYIGVTSDALQCAAACVVYWENHGTP